MSPNLESFLPITRRSLYGESVRRLTSDRYAVVSFLVILFYILLALLAETHLIFPHVADFHNDQALHSPSLEHWFGTDIFGRDVLAKAIYATHTALFIGFIASAIAIPIGTVLGATAGYFGGWIDQGITWFYTTIDSIPSILFIISLAYVLGPGLVNTYIAIGTTSWVSLCRLIRAEFLRQRERDYVVAAGALGASHWRRIFNHILPNVFHLILIQFSLIFVYAIKSEVVLSYLGLGAEAGQFSWGIMIDDAKQSLIQGIWWELTCATLAMFFIVLAFNVFNDSLIAALDPKRKNL